MPPFQEQLHIVNRGGVGFIGGQALDARPQAAMDVVLQARMGVRSREIHFAGRNLEVAMDEVHQPMRQVAGKIWAVVSGTVLDQAARHVHARILLAGQLDIRECFVIPQQDVEAGLPLLNQVIFKRQRLFVVVHQDVFDVARV